jgi:reactive intermediate/imine deaminase
MQPDLERTARKVKRLAALGGVRHSQHRFRGAPMSKTVISSDNAPAAIGPYSQAIKAGNTVYMSGQIPLDPKTMELVEGFEAQTVQVFENLKTVAAAAGGSFKDIVKLNIFLTDLSHFATVNDVMSRYFVQPYPARAAIGVAALPRGAAVEMDAILVIE